MSRSKRKAAAIGPERLAAFPIFEGMSSAQLARLWEIVEVREYPAGEVIVQEGESGDALYLLLAGEVEVSKSLTLMVARGNVDTRDKALDRLSAAQSPFFGEMALLDDSHHRTATVRTLTESTLGLLRRKPCMTLCHEDPSLGFLLMRNIASTLATRLDKANKDILKLTTAFSLALRE
ncbi:MAG: cyclic nucleotide-binding domain-containing protein [Calditrichaeota bacterium]|nr:cyclic nucleotide-binding domain-containing protein [Calditrichota bacterium]